MSVDGPPASGSMPNVQSPSLVGEVLDGRYKIFRKLGEGGMGEVYAAEHVHIDKKFAIKLLRPEIVSNQEAVSRFQQEARSSSGIKHRNIIAIDDFGKTPDGRVYMCMELLNGAALNDLITQPQTVERLLNILIQTGHGLAAAHARNIVHRDMKPENIFVTIGPNGEDIPKILDFGIAKVSGNDGQNHLTRTGTIFGTPFYMAPEQALGNPVDARTDIYAVGVIMYEVFSGSLPFQGESFMGILTQHITTEPEPVAQRAAKAGRTLPPGLAEVITRCMQKNPAQRFATMDELVNVLVQIYRGIAGAGMSTYMEAFPVSSQHPVPTPPPMTGGYPASPNAATQAAQPSAGYPMPSGGHAAITPSGSASVASAASGAYDASGSIVAPKKSKAGLIIAIFAVLAVGGGITAFVLLNNKDGGAGAGSGVASNDPGSGSTKVAGTTPGSDHGGSATVPHNGSDSHIGGAITGVDAGVAVIAVGPADAAALAVVPADAAAVEVPADAAALAAKSIQVPLFASNVAGFEVWEDGKKLFDGPDNLEVPEGAQRTVVIKAKGFKDKTIVVDTSKKRVQFALARIPSVTVPPPPATKCTGTKADLKSDACRPIYCKNHSDDPLCDME